MRGYVVKKGSQYYAVIYEGVDPTTGKERRRWHPGGPLKRDAERLVNELVKRKDDGTYRGPDRLTLGEYLTQRWLPGQVSQLAPSTFDSYRRNIELHVLPRIGGVPLQKLAAEDLDRLYAELSTDGRRDGKPGGLAPKSVRIVHAILHKALSDARRKGTLTRNVAEVADPPKRRSAKRPEMKVWSPEELHAFLDGAAKNRNHAAWFLSSHTGMRRGEVLGLRWGDVDLDRRRLAVRQAVILVAYKLTISDVKTDNGRRSIDLDERTVAVLRTWRKRQLEERMLVGPAVYQDNDLVFARPDGTPTNPDAFSQSFDRLLARGTQPRIRLHDLRHTHASILLKAGVPVKVVSERLGHANPAFTITVYQHIIPGMQADAATVFSDLVAGVVPPAVPLSDVADDE